MAGGVRLGTVLLGVDREIAGVLWLEVAPLDVVSEVDATVSLELFAELACGEFPSAVSDDAVMLFLELDFRLTPATGAVRNIGVRVFWTRMFTLVMVTVLAGAAVEAEGGGGGGGGVYAEVVVGGGGGGGVNVSV